MTDLSIKKTQELLREKKISVKELVLFYYDRIAKIDRKIGAYLALNQERALKKAKELDKQDLKSYNPLAGIPFCVKDNLVTEGLETTAGSKTLKGYFPTYTATSIQKLQNEDAIILGKGNCDAFAFGASGENSGFFPTKNPWDLSRVPGGSSSGPTAAVAANLCVFAIGTDTGGSVRQPASLCGIVGLKPTYGLVSRWGLIAMASSFDCPGPITKTVEDAAIILNEIAGQDPQDATTSSAPTDNYSKTIDSGIRGLKIGLPKEYFVKGIQKEVKEAVFEAARVLEKQKANIVNISLPNTEYALAVYYILVPSEISANMSRYDGVRFGYRSNHGITAQEQTAFSRQESLEDELKRRIIIGTFSLSSGYYDAYYLKASKVRRLILNDFETAFKKVDAIICPTSPTTAFKLGEKIEDPLQMYLSDIFTVSANLAGIPGISVPCGFDHQGLPIGLQILGKHFDEKTILRIARAYEQSTNWSKIRPKL